MKRSTLAALALAATASTSTAQDTIGTTKDWGNLTVSLEAASFRGNRAAVALKFRNQTEKPESISSLLLFEMLSLDGDHGDFDMLTSECDGTVPPLGAFKCTLVYSFAAPPQGISLKVGAGIMTDAVYFTIKP